MQNMSDNELDNLFKEAAEGFTPPQDGSAWKDMASLLDKNPIKPASFWNWKTISGVTATGLLAVTAVWFATTTQEGITKTITENGSNNATQGVVQEQKEQSHPTGKQDLAPSQSVEDKSSGTRAVGSTESKVKSKAEQRGEHNVESGTEPKRASNQITSKPSSVTGNKGTATKNSDGVSAGSAVAVVPIVNESGTAVRSESNSSATSAHKNDDMLAVDSVKAVAKQVALTDSTESSTEIASKMDSESKARGVVSIKAVVSPDYSSVNYFSAAKTGINYGLLAGYSFNNRWSVYTGVISSKKLYDTKEIETSYFIDGQDYPVKEVKGDCRILDIPINVYYTFFPERSFSIRAGLGLSSYIMRRETYVYCVDNYGTDAYYEQNVNGKNNEWFKVMNLSVAVSKKLTPRLSAEFEPFVKAPLAGVGEGKVSLVSMGAFINLKYDLIIFKK